MKLSDTTTDLATGLLTLGIASFAMGVRKVHTQLDIPEPVRQLYTFFVALLALFNLTGLPSKIVKEQWEETIFGKSFFPTASLTILQKRRLAGLIESTGLALSTLSTNPTLRASGYGIIFVMYGRGAMVNSRIGLGSTLFTLLISATALFLFTAELQIDLVTDVVQ